VVTHGSEPLFPWLHRPLHEALALQAAHALLLHGPDGNGQFQLALAIAQSFVCEARRAGQRVEPACGACAGCRLFVARTHPDVFILVPDALRETLGIPEALMGDDIGSVVAAGKAKPSKEIRVDGVRAAISFAQSTSARGFGKTVVVHPAESVNSIAANALLKSLEEPAGRTRYILSCNAVDALLPTVRSRCVTVSVGLPTADQAVAWLEARGVDQPRIMLAATGGRPIETLQWAASDIDADAWLGIPNRVAQGRVESFVDWPLGRLIETLQKLCHDWICASIDAPPRYFPRQCLGDPCDVSRLLAWSAQLRNHARHAEHPWQVSLKIDALIQQGHSAFVAPMVNETAQVRGLSGHASLHFTA